MLAMKTSRSPHQTRSAETPSTHRRQIWTEVGYQTCTHYKLLINYYCSGNLTTKSWQAGKVEEHVKKIQKKYIQIVQVDRFVSFPRLFPC